MKQPCDVSHLGEKAGKAAAHWIVYYYCIFRKRGNILDKNIQYPPLILDNHIIERVKYTKYLGIIIDEFITFKEHTNHLVNKLKQYCGIFYKFRSRLPKKCLRTIYFAMIHSHLNYGVAIYGNTTASQLEPLLKINNKILRILQSKPLKTPVEQLYNNYNTLQITELRDYNALFTNLFITSKTCLKYITVILHSILKFILITPEHPQICIFNNSIQTLDIEISKF